MGIAVLAAAKKGDHLKRKRDTSVKSRSSKIISLSAVAKH